MKIKPIKTYRLHNHDHFLFMTEVKNTINSSHLGFTSIQDEYRNFSELYNKETTLLKTRGKLGSSLSDKMEESDSKRDDYHRGIELIIKGYQRHADENIRNAARNLMEIFNKYGDLRPIPYEEETNLIDNLCEDMEKYPEDMKKLHLSEWVKMLKEENITFRYYLDEVKREFIDVSSSNYLKTLRHRIDKAYENLKFRIEALSTIENTPTYKFAVDRLNKIIDGFFVRYKYNGENFLSDNNYPDSNHNIITESYY